MESYFLISSFLILILLYAGAWISSAETALFSLSSHKIKTYKTNPDPKKRLIAELLAHPRDLLVTVFMINTCINILLQNVASDMFGKEAGWELKVGFPLILTLIFGEIIPKYIGMQNNSAIAYRISPTIDKLNRFLKQIRQMVIAITTPVSRVLFFFLKKEKDISKEELGHVIKTSTELGVVDHGEAELLKGFLHLQEMPVKELMQPKEDIIFYDIKDPLSKLLYLFIDKQYTRVPVCQGSFEGLLGMVTPMLYFQHQESILEPKDICPYLIKPFYTPETISARLLLKRMNESGQILALVVDEYGSVIGLISREDLIEIVVGQIEDEKNSNPLYTVAGKHEVICSGKWELSEFNKHFNAYLKSQSHLVTIGGWLSEEIGDIPTGGTKVDLEGFHFHVLAATPKRITRLFIRKLQNKSG